MLWVDHIATRYQLTMNSGISNYLDSGRNPIAGQWQHLTATYDGGTARFYIDGTEVANRPVSVSIGSSNNWRIGAYGASPGGFFDGLIDNVRIYNRALTPTEIQTDMNQPVAPGAPSDTANLRRLPAGSAPPAARTRRRSRGRPRPTTSASRGTTSTARPRPGSLPALRIALRSRPARATPTARWRRAPTTTRSPRRTAPATSAPPRTRRARPSRQLRTRRHPAPRDAHGDAVERPGSAQLGRRDGQRRRRAVQRPPLDDRRASPRAPRTGSHSPRARPTRTPGSPRAPTTTRSPPRTRRATSAQRPTRRASS